MPRTRQEWNEFVRKEGTSGDQVFTILQDWLLGEVSIKKECAVQAHDLLTSCKELREVSAICFRVLAAIHSNSVQQQLDHELKIAGIREGFGVRAQIAIKKSGG